MTCLHASDVSSTSPRLDPQHGGPQVMGIAGSSGTGSHSSGACSSSSSGATSSSATLCRLKEQADLLASRGRYTEALELVAEALLLDPQRADLHHGKGQCLGRLGQYEDAVHCFEQALECDASHVVSLRTKAPALMELHRWEDAAVCFRELLKLEPANRELQMELARCLMEQGVQLKTAGQSNPQLFRDSARACEAYAPAYFQLGVEHSEAGQAASAKEMYTKAVQLNPAYIEAWNNLGVACRSLGEPMHASEAYSMALKMNKNCKKTRDNMAICLMELGCKSLERKEFKEASGYLKQGLTYNSLNADIYFNLGVMYSECKKFDKSRVQYELATHIDNNHANAFNNLGVIFRRQGNVESASRCFERALQLDSKMSLANKNLGALYGAQGRMADSIRLTRVALEGNAADAEACNNLALLLRDQADIEPCLEYLDTCLKLESESTHAWSNKLMTLNYPSEKTREEVFEAHRSWGERLELRTPVQFTSYKPRERVLRIGYVSPDFYSHSVSYFIHAALRYHDPLNVQVTCYSDVAVEDAKTQLFRSYVPRWRNIFGLSDEEAARLIHEDGIDVLVELTGHTGNNRLAMLAKKPAPVIVTWIGYPHTTGLSRVDYRISDERVDPAAAPGLTSEKLVYLPECFLCYTPSDNPPSLNLKPAQEMYGCITFGCFNNIAKVSALTIRLWCRLLHEVPDARLFLKSKALQCPDVQEKFRRLFAAHGIQRQRLDLSGLQPQTGSHLQMYSLIDVALDTAPYAGTTTTAESLFMGVPVVSLHCDGIHAQNVGTSLLTAVQLGDLVAVNEDEYVQKASELARNRTRLGALRAGLRSRMLQSVLCDGPRHTARLERLYASLTASIDLPTDSHPNDSCAEAQAEVQ